MLFLTQTACSIPTALYCCGWAGAEIPVLNAPLAANTVNRLTQGPATLPAAGALDDGLIVHNDSDTTLLGLAPGEVGYWRYNGTAWVRR